jgi:hypothetical protein
MTTLKQREEARLINLLKIRLCDVREATDRIKGINRQLRELSVRSPVQLPPLPAGVEINRAIDSLRKAGGRLTSTADSKRRPPGAKLRGVIRLWGQRIKSPGNDFHGRRR